MGKGNITSAGKLPEKMVAQVCTKTRHLKRGQIILELEYSGEKPASDRARFLSLGGSSAGVSSMEQEHCDRGFCITLNQGDITAEAGLCVVVPCHYRIDNKYFKVQHYIWHRCQESKERCENSDIIFHSNKKNVRGNILLLEPNLPQQNCSIMINDLTESDSGSYQFRVNGLQHNQMTGFTFMARTSVAIKGLTQRPTLKIPPLTEKQISTLTCTAPGLCSGLVPTITWIWERAEMDISHSVINITKFLTENVTDFTRRHSSMLSFISSAKYHRTQVTCKVTFQGNVTTEKTATLNVTYMSGPGIRGNTAVKKGDLLNLTCSVKSFPSSSILWYKLGSNEIARHYELTNTTETVSLVIPNVAAEHSGRYICIANNQIKTEEVYVDVTVNWFANILPDSGCKAQDASLTCVCLSKGVPLPSVSWPLLENYTEYLVVTSETKDTINSTISLTLKDNKTMVECVVKHTNRETKKTLQITITNTEEFSQIVSWLKDIALVLLGALVSALICCLVFTCWRKKQKSSKDISKTKDEGPQTQSTNGEMEYDCIQYQNLAKDGADEDEEGGPEYTGVFRDVDYANIDFSVLKKKHDRHSSEKPETEYAEIQREKNVKNDGELHERHECREEGMMAAEDGGLEEEEDVPLY